MVGAPVDEIEALNPSLLRMVTPPEARFDLHLPAGTATLFQQRAALIPEARRNSWRYHVVVAGDTLQSVAQEYRVPVAELASANQLKTTDSAAGIDALVVPMAPVAETPAHTRLYTVRRGDTLVTIADRFGVSLSQLRRWNGIPSGIRVDPGRRLHVAEPAPVPASTAHRRRNSTTGSAHSKSSTSKGPHPQGARTPSGAKAGAEHKPVGAAHKPASAAHKPAGIARKSSQK